MQEHKQKVAALQSALQTTQEKLNQQTSAYKEQVNLIAVKYFMLFIVPYTEGFVIVLLNPLSINVRDSIKFLSS